MVHRVDSGEGPAVKSAGLPTCANATPHYHASAVTRSIVLTKRRKVGATRNHFPELSPFRLPLISRVQSSSSRGC